MGIIQKQAVRGAIYSYIGVGVGFVTTALFFPHILSTEQIGLLKLLVSFSLLFAQFGSLGFSNVINRLFPYFREEGKSGFLTVSIGITLIGFVLSIVGLEILRPLIIRNNLEDSTLLVEYFNYLYPLIFFTLFFNLLDNYIKALYDAVIGLMLKELLQRVLILISIVLFYFNVLSFPNFVILYVLALSLPTLILIIVLGLNKELRFSLPGSIFTKRMWREILMLCIHGMIGGFGSIIILQLDSIMVNKYLGISMTGIYATAFFFAAIILIPSRALLKISTTVVADAWKSNDLAKISDIYKRSCLTQTIIALILFVGLWVNIDNIFRMLPPEFEAGKWVIFFVGLKNVIEMATGMNSVIILTSSHYKLFSLFILLFMGILVGLLVLLIPPFGLTGAAISILISFIVFTLMRHFYLRLKYKMEAFDYRTILVLLIGLLAYLAGYMLPLISNFVIDIIIRSIITGAVYFALIVFLKISSDINIYLNQLFRTDFFYKE
jgi:O-antigen/teichoic acid export membrane protein